MAEKSKFQDMSLRDKRKLITESSIVIGAVLLLCYFFGFSYVWNTSYGSEAGVNGWNYIFACLSWNFKGTGAIYGDIAVPFNYYAKYYVRILAVGTTVSLPVLLSIIVLSCFNVKTYHVKLEKVVMVLLYVLAFVFLFCIVVALTMNGSKILPKYCNSNPKCSVATLIFIPFFITLASAILHTVFLVKVKEDE